MSFLISAYNEESVIVEKLRNTLSLTPAPFEVIVIADGSTDETAQLAREVADDRVCVLFEHERRGKCAAINRGADRSSGDVLVLSDANNIFADDALNALLAPFADNRVGGVSGLRGVHSGESELATGEGAYGRYEQMIRSMESELGACTAASGEIMAIRSELFEPIPEDVSTDDLYLAMSVLGQGRRFEFAPRARCFEPAADSDGSEFERRSRFSAARLWLIRRPGFVTQGGPRVTWQFLSHKVGRLVAPFLFIGALLGATWACVTPSSRQGLYRLGRPWAQLAFAGQAAGWGLGVLVRFQPRWVPTRMAPAARAIWFLLLGNAAILNGWWRFLRGRREVIWERVGRSSADIPAR